jgi:hypothetical protein
MKILTYLGINSGIGAGVGALAAFALPTLPPSLGESNLCSSGNGLLSACSRATDPACIQECENVFGGAAW